MGISATPDTFKAMINNRGGLARTNRYAIYMTHPVSKQGLLNTDFGSLIGQAARSIIGGSGVGLNVGSFFNDPRDIYLMCDSVNLPGRQIVTQEYYTNLRGRKRPYNYINDDVSMSFHLTNDYYMWKYIKSWMDGTVSEQEDNRYNIAYKEDYVTDITIQQLALNGNTFVPVYSIKLRNAYPISMSSVNLSQNENETAKCNVTFAYDEWEEMNLAENLGATLGTGAKLIKNTFGL